MVDSLELQALHSIHLKEWLIAPVVHLAGNGHLLQDYPTQILYLGRYYDSVEERFVIVNVPYLTRLAYAFAISETLGTEVASAVVRVVVETQVHEEADRDGSCPTLAGIAMDDDDVFGVTY